MQFDRPHHVFNGTIMKRKGCSIIFLNNQRQLLLLLRDDIPTIPCPNMWDLPGGHVEDYETPEECIVREMKEEMGVGIEGFQLFSVKEYDDRVEYVYWMKFDLDIETVVLTEGQRLKWFSEIDARTTELAYGFNQIVDDFFGRTPFN